MSSNISRRAALGTIGTCGLTMGGCGEVATRAAAPVTNRLNLICHGPMIFWVQDHNLRIYLPANLPNNPKISTHVARILYLGGSVVLGQNEYKLALNAQNSGGYVPDKTKDVVLFKRDGSYTLTIDPSASTFLQLPYPHRVRPFLRMNFKKLLSKHPAYDQTKNVTKAFDVNPDQIPGVHVLSWSLNPSDTDGIVLSLFQDSKNPIAKWNVPRGYLNLHLFYQPLECVGMEDHLPLINNALNITYSGTPTHVEFAKANDPYSYLADNFTEEEDISQSDMRSLNEVDPGGTQCLSAHSHPRVLDQADCIQVWGS